MGHQVYALEKAIRPLFADRVTYINNTSKEETKPNPDSTPNSKIQDVSPNFECSGNIARRVP